MSDILSVLSSAYKATATPTPASTKPYTNVDPKAYQGSWQGTYTNGKKFQLTISQVQGFRAAVKFQSGSTVQFQQVLIGNSSFRVGDTKFALTGTGKAQVGTAITDLATGNTTLLQGNATLS